MSSPTNMDKSCDTADLNSTPQELVPIFSEVKLATIPLNLQVPSRFSLKSPGVHQFIVEHTSPCGLNLLACGCPLAFLDLRVHLTVPLEDFSQNPLLPCDRCSPGNTDKKKT